MAGRCDIAAHIEHEELPAWLINHLKTQDNWYTNLLILDEYFAKLKL